MNTKKYFFILSLAFVSFFGLCLAEQDIYVFTDFGGGNKSQNQPITDWQTAIELAGEGWKLTKHSQLFIHDGAALTSEISVLEPLIAYLVDKYHWTRKRAALAAGAMAFVIGIPCALSTNLLADWNLWGKNILELFDLIATTLLVPIGGFLGVVLVTWRWGFSSTFNELTNGKREKHPIGYLYLKVCLKYLAPALILVIFFSNLK